VLGTWKERKRKENKRKSGKEITHVDEWHVAVSGCRSA
jgi:hypothetical protein